MEQMVNVFVMGKKYEVPASLTIMKALEYAALHIWILRCLPLHLSGVDLFGVVLIGGFSGSGCVEEHGFLAVRISAVSMRFFHIGLLSGFASYRMRTASAVIAVKIK